MPDPAASRPRPVARGRLLRRIEAMGVRSTAAHWSVIPPDLARRLRARVTRVGGALLTIAGASDSLHVNRVMGLARGGDARGETISRIVAAYRAARVRRFAVMLGPAPRSRRLVEHLRARGFGRRPGLSLLVRDARLAVPATPCGVRVARARLRDAHAVSAIHERCFGEPASRRAWRRAAIAAGGSEQYLAFVDGRPVGAGALRVDGDLAWIGAGATLTPWRRRGVHRALIAARLRRAARLGCRHMWVETAAPLPGRPAGSHRNLLRLGFERVGEIPRFVWRGR